jgi:hypothetical protein
MKLRLHFGVPPQKIREVNWYDDIMKMPRVMKMDDKHWVWQMYDKAIGDSVDYVLTYTETSDASRYIGLDIVEFDSVFGWQWGDDAQCDCGAKYDRGFENWHYRWCKTQEFKK